MMSRHAVHRIIEPESLTHGNHRPAEDVDVSPCIVAAETGFVQAQTRFYVIERMSGATGFAEEHLGNVDGIDAVHFPR